MRAISVFSGGPDLDWAMRRLCAMVDRQGADLTGMSGVALVEHLQQAIGGKPAAFEHLRRDQNVTHSLIELQAFLSDLSIHRRALAAHGGRDIFQGTLVKAWNALLEYFPRHEPTFAGACLGNMEALAAFDTSPPGTGHLSATAWISTQLAAMGFTIDSTPGPKPVIVARRESRGLKGHVLMYNHYDTIGAGDGGSWGSDPHEPLVIDGRCYFLGAADNKGPLAVRLAAIEHMDQTPELTWLIQGEEETGSSLAHATFPGAMGEGPDIWLDETGYVDLTGNQRLLVTGPPEVASSLCIRLAAVARRHGREATLLGRRLNKDLHRRGCPFSSNVPEPRLYAAIGVNDDHARIHEPDESIPTNTWALHLDQMTALFQWGDDFARQKGGQDPALVN